MIFWNERNELTLYNKISLMLFSMPNSIGVGLGVGQNVHIAEITLMLTAVAANVTILEKWWYLLVVVHEAQLCSTCIVTPRHLTQPRTSCV